MGGCLLPKIVDYDLMREQIIDQAMVVFGQKGYHYTSLSDVASQCGMARTSLYQYFKNKDEIFAEVVKKVLDDIEDECRPILNQSDLTAVDKIKTIFGHFVTQYQDEKYKIRILLDIRVIMKMKKQNRLNGIADRIESFRQLFLPLLNEGMQKKEIKDVDAESMSSTLYNLLESLWSKVSFYKDSNFQLYLRSLHILIDGLKA
jgi:AcrR family transcriptional regulator